MTDEEKAIAWCEDLIVQSKEIMPQCSDALKAELAEQMEFAETALSTLRDRIARQNPRPLTLDELRKMDGEPVWLKDGIGEGWFLASAVVGSKIYFCEKSITIGEPISECGKTWLAYRTKPEPPERS
ncbi:hypothetical protein [Oscillibacter ruminantium]|nr:hypothetical protein [Oscillibacter valericigenes]